jgi:phage terminase large subunit
MAKPFQLAIQENEEVLLCGAAGTGKTLRILYFINDVLWNYPGARVLIVRKVRADLAQSTLVTYERDVMGLDNPIVNTVQRESRKSYKYPNGSEIVVGGMD